MKQILLLLLSFIFFQPLVAQDISERFNFLMDKNPAVNTIKPATVQTNRQIYWSDDFSDTSNWVMTNTSTPPVDWIITTNANSSPFGGLNPINLPTASNGFAFIDGDVMGDGSTQNSNITTANPIDLSDHDFVQLRFSQVTRNWASQYFVRVSNNGGATWTEYNANPNLATNTNTGNPETVTINISDAAGGQSAVLLQFNFQADWGWFWAIDDIFLEEISPINIATSTFHYTLQNPTQPVHSIGNDTMFFAVTVINSGLDLDILGTAEIINVATEDVIHSQQKTVPVSAGQLTAIEFDNPFPMQGIAIGDYIVRYTIEDADGGEDIDPSDNVRSYPFSVTENLMVNGTQTTATLLAGVSPSGWGYGTSFWGPTDPNIKFHLTQVSTGFFGWSGASDLTDAETTLFLVRKGPNFGSSNPSFSNFDPNQMEILGFGEKILSSANHSTGANPVLTTYDVQRFDFEDGPVVIEPGEEYFVIAIVPDVAGANSGVGFVSTDGSFPNYVVGLDADGEAITGFIYVNNRIYNNDEFSGNFGGRAPYYRIEFNIATSTGTPQLNELSYSIYPNPVAGDFVNLELNLERSLRTNVYISDINGKLLKANIFEGAVTQNQINVSDLPAGTYMMIISNEDGVATSKFQVVK